MKKRRSQQRKRYQQRPLTFPSIKMNPSNYVWNYSTTALNGVTTSNRGINKCAFLSKKMGLRFLQSVCTYVTALSSRASPSSKLSIWLHIFATLSWPLIFFGPSRPRVITPIKSLNRIVITKARYRCSLTTHMNMNNKLLLKPIWSKLEILYHFLYRFHT